MQIVKKHKNIEIINTKLFKFSVHSATNHLKYLESSVHLKVLYLTLPMPL